MKKLIKFKDDALKIKPIKNYVVFRKELQKKFKGELYRYVLPKAFRDMELAEDNEIELVFAKNIVEPVNYDKKFFLEETDEEDNMPEVLARYNDEEVLIVGKMCNQDDCNIVLEVDVENTYYHALQVFLSFFDYHYSYLVGDKFYIIIC